jgi:2-polyprenyl-3-methyl-5-hydroxy-6-metoxy-1,4-benzoquinol methylase
MANHAVKDFYNSQMPGKFGDDYEHERWFRDDIQRAGYHLTLRAVSRHVLSDERLNPSRVLELGPGAGTWTKFLAKRFPRAKIDVVDISREMLARAKKALEKETHISYTETDILDWTPKVTYDFFFSSRVIEYIDDKQAFVDKIFSVLSPGARGFVITKMPHYTREKLLRRKSSTLHQGQIEPSELLKLFRDAGFHDVVAYPVTVSIPVLHNAKWNARLGRFLDQFPLGLFGLVVSESYGVVFRKPDAS